MPGVHTFYDGSQMFEPLSRVVGVETDKINLVMCLVAAVPLSYSYNVHMKAGKVSKEVRVIFPTIVGLSFCFFCFGWAIKHILWNVIINYAVIRLAPQQYVHKLVFLVATGYLTFIHFYRWKILKEYYLDITGPMMIMVQKVTMLAFQLHDGRCKKQEELMEHQKREALTEAPPLLMYLSYCFHFQAVLTGPMCLYVDFVHFIDGTHIPADKKGQIPSPISTGVRKLAIAAGLVFSISIFSGSLYVERLAEDRDLSKPLLQWLAIWWVCIFFSRVQYYFAWVMSDAICNLSGFGFSGYDENGKATWNMMTSVDMQKVEMAQSLKETLDNWNIPTVAWLRRAAFDRAPRRYRTLATYALSAWWHGLFPGYYIAFGTTALFTFAARTFRRCFRYRFLGSSSSKFVYNAITFMATKIALAYAAYSFVTMHAYPAMFIYSRIYFLPHIIAVLMIFTIPMFFRPEKKKIDEKNELKKEL
ncbi:unnamed protein product, partial [Mesorhabditis belari]|uniref:Uncharacterized protein n=1 Tax=Mesorhabditis belari TaxID=2138241 RepID=A0AAF3EYZ7_9BILA